MFFGEQEEKIVSKSHLSILGKPPSQAWPGSTHACREVGVGKEKKERKTGF